MKTNQQQRDHVFPEFFLFFIIIINVTANLDYLLETI